MAGSSVEKGSRQILQASSKESSTAAAEDDDDPAEDEAVKLAIWNWESERMWRDFWVKMTSESYEWIEGDWREMWTKKGTLEKCRHRERERKREKEWVVKRKKRILARKVKARIWKKRRKIIRFRRFCFEWNQSSSPPHPLLTLPLSFPFKFLLSFI